MGITLGNVYQGDCLEVMQDIADESVDMILCDLPYGTTRNRRECDIPLDGLWEQYRRVIKPNGAIALNAQGLFTAKLILSNESWYRYKYVWVKSKSTNYLSARHQPLRQHEDICIFYRKQPRCRPIMWKGLSYDKGARKRQYSGSYNDFLPAHVKSEGERIPTDTLYCKTAESEEGGGRVWHPAQKPVALGRYLILMYTSPNEIVLDNAFGSGSYLVAAAIEGRRYIGIERNQEGHLFNEKKIDYLQVARERLAEVEQAKELGHDPSPLLSMLQPSARNEKDGEVKMTDVDVALEASDRSRNEVRKNV